MASVVTATHTRARAVFRAVGLAHSVRPFDVRLAVAVAEADEPDEPRVRSDVLAAQLAVDRASVRRSIGTLRARGLVVTQGADGGLTRPGVWSVVELTESGAAMARAAIFGCTDATVWHA